MTRWSAWQGQWHRERPDLDPTSMAVLARLTRAHVAATVAIEDTLREFGVNRGEFDVLASLRRAGEPFRLSPGELASAMVLSPSAMTNRLERLATRGLVERRPDPADGRHGIVDLTAAGKDLVDRAVGAHVTTLDGILAPLSAAIGRPWGVCSPGSTLTGARWCRCMRR